MSFLLINEKGKIRGMPVTRYTYMNGMHMMFYFTFFSPTTSHRVHGHTHPRSHGFFKENKFNQEANI